MAAALQRLLVASKGKGMPACRSDLEGVANEGVDGHLDLQRQVGGSMEACGLSSVSQQRHEWGDKRV